MADCIGLVLLIGIRKDAGAEDEGKSKEELVSSIFHRIIVGVSRS